MAGSVNKAILVGNLGADPEVRQTQDGRPMATLSLATSEKWKDRNTGEQRERTEWHKVVVFNEGLVRVVENYLRKGAKVYIEGQIQTRKWQDQTSGADRYTTEIVLRGFNSQLQMLDSRSSGGDGDYPRRQSNDGYENRSSDGGGSYGGGSGRSDSPQKDNEPNYSDSDDDDDDVPF